MIISLEFGSSHIKVYEANNGLILYEPTIAIAKLKKRKASVVSFGKNAYELSTQLSDDEKLIQPIKNGIIVDFHDAKLLLDKVFDVIIGNRKKRKELELILCIPTCATSFQIEEFIKLINSCGVSAVSIRPQLNCICKILDDDISRPYFIVDIGAGKTEIGLTTTRKVIDAISLSLGGEMVDNVTYEKTTFDEPPARFEAGTPAFIEAIGLGAALEYMMTLGQKNIIEHEQELVKYTTQALNAVEGLKQIGTATEKGGVFSFVVDGIHPQDLAFILSKEGVAIRTGHHCAEPLVHRFGYESVARASIGLYTNHEDIDILVSSIEKAKKFF